MRKLKPCCIRGVAYPSHAAAAAALGLTRQRIHQLARQPGEDRRKPQGGKPVTIDGTTYASVADAADALAVSYWAARYFARLGTAPQRRAMRTKANSTARAKPRHPPVRNAIKVMRRVVLILEGSIWIRRLPPQNQCAIAKARQILQEQADLLAGWGACGTTR